MKRITVLLASTLAAGAVLAEPPHIKPGLWETTVSVEVSGMENMPGMKKGMMPSREPSTFQHCYRPKEAKDLRNTVPKQSNCKLENWKQSGKSVTWTMNCGGPAAMTMTGEMTYEGDSYRGIGKATMNMGGQSMQMTQRFSARRVGDCK